MDMNLYYCSICDKDTLHEVLNANYDALTVKCTACDTTSIAEPENFNNYEEVAMEWDEEVQEIIDGWEE